MKIMKLKHTQYYADDGYWYDDLQEARENSLDKTNIQVVRKQKVRVCKASETGRYLSGDYKYAVYSMKNVFLFYCDSLEDFEELE